MRVRAGEHQVDSTSKGFTNAIFAQPAANDGELHAKFAATVAPNTHAEIGSLPGGQEATYLDADMKPGHDAFAAVGEGQYDISHPDADKYAPVTPLVQGHFDVDVGSGND